MSVAVREAWMIQVQLEDKVSASCLMCVFARRLKGTGVEVDRRFTPTRVAPGRFVGRGLATKRAVLKAMCRSGIALFKEIRHA